MNSPSMDSAHPAPADQDGPTDGQIDAVMLATRVLVGVTARAMAATEDQVTLPQLRVLVMVASRRSLNLRAVAEGLSVHASNATRICDRLVVAGLLSRRDDPADRRHLILELTPAGQRLVDRVNQLRRVAVGDVLGRMPQRSRDVLTAILLDFAEAAGEIDHESGAWSLGWTTDRPSDSPTGTEELVTARPD